MTGRPSPLGAAPYYSSYIDRITGDGVVAEEKDALGVGDVIQELAGWTICPARSRALWFARGFDTPLLPGFDQNIGTPNAAANQFS